MKGFIKKIIKLFAINRFDFDEIIINKSVIRDIITFAKDSYPNEFITLLKGNIKDKRLIIDYLIYQIYQSSTEATSIKLDLPLVSGVIGSVHSHPSYSNKPSKADLIFFNKIYSIHLIISNPFTESNIQAYNCYGDKIMFKIGDQNI